MSSGATPTSSRELFDLPTRRSNVKQLFALLNKEIDEKAPANIIFFLVDFLCQYYPDHLGGFAAVWNGDPGLEKERIQVVEFFRFQKLPIDIASHFTKAGYDTLETLCTITPEALETIEKFNRVEWLPGHRVRLQQTFSDVVSKVRAYRQEREKLLHIARLTNGHCDHPVVVTRTNAPPPFIPALSMGPSPLPQIQPGTPTPTITTVMPPPVSSVPIGGSPAHPFIVTPMN